MVVCTRVCEADRWRDRAPGQAVFERLIARTPSGRTGFFEPDEFPWIADIEARAGEIKEELAGLLARVDQLPNFQDIQVEPRMLTEDDRWKIFGFYAYGAPRRRQLPAMPAHR
jgi:aspartyl/asparaginyl beta-hydroxylase (cupin superfamily)